VFGEKLRRQREQRGIALEAISNSTKISTRMLRALEEENFEQLPGGVFNKGFVRAYARQIGLDEEEAIGDYLAALTESQIRAQQILPNLRGGKPTPISPPHPYHSPSRAVEDVRRETRPATGEPQRSEFVEKSPTGNPGAREQIAPASKTSLHEAAPDKEDRPNEERRNEERRNEDRRNEDRRADQRRANKTRQPGWRAESQSERRFSEAAPLLEGRRASDLLSEAPRAGDAERIQQSTPLFASGTFGESESGVSNGISWGKLAAVVIVIFALIAFWNVHRRNRARLETRSSAPSALLEPAGLQSPAQSSAEIEPQRTSAAAGKSSSNQTTSAPSMRAVVGASTPAVQTSAAAQAGAGQPPRVSVATPQRLKVTGAPPAKAPAVFTLRIRAQETSWISVVADGQQVAQETLIAPAETSIRASDRIVVRTGNAAGISFLFNAKEIPSQGKEGEVRTYTFDSTGLRESPSQPPSLTN